MKSGQCEQKKKNKSIIMRYVRVQIQGKVIILYIFLKSRKIHPGQLFFQDSHIWFSLILKNYSLCHKTFALGSKSQISRDYLFLLDKTE